MAFRDDREAAHARADALARALADKEAALAAKERELEEARQRLATAERQDAAREAAAPVPSNNAAAEAALAAVKARAAQRASAKERAETLARAQSEKEDERERAQRVLRSVSLLADYSWSIALIPLGIPGFWAATYLSVRYGFYFLPLIAGSILALSLGLGVLARKRARVLLAREYAWVDGLPYELTGYPELLAVKPRTTVHDSMRDMHDRMFEHFGSSLGRRSDNDDGDGRLDHSNGHGYVLVTLHFAGDEPRDLDAVMRGFDDSLERRPSRRFRGTSPVTQRHTKSGASTFTEDTNAEVRKWVRRLDRDVLQPLHRAHALTRVDLELR